MTTNAYYHAVITVRCPVNGNAWDETFVITTPAGIDAAGHQALRMAAWNGYQVQGLRSVTDATPFYMAIEELEAMKAAILALANTGAGISAISNADRELLRKVQKAIDLKTAE